MLSLDYSTFLKILVPTFLKFIKKIFIIFFKILFPLIYGHILMVSDFADDKSFVVGIVYMCGPYETWPFPRIPPSRGI